MEEDQERMRDWLRSLGAPEAILNVDLSLLLRAEDSAMWRHLQRHVMPAATVVKIRRIILLDTLREKNTLPGSFGKFKINSVEQMEQVETYFEKKNELAELRLQTNRVETELASSEKTLVKNICKSRSLSREIEEKTMKTQLLREKVAQVKKNIDYLNCHLEAVRLKSQPETTASMDTKTVEKLVCKFQLEDCDPERIKNTIDCLISIPPKIVLRGLERASRNAFIMLIKMFKNTDKDMNNVKDNLELNGNLPIEQHLSKLQAYYLDNEVKLSVVQNDFDTISLKLNEEKAGLVKAIIESIGPDDPNMEENRPLIQEFADLMAKRELKISQVKEARHVINMENQQIKKLQEKKFHLQERFQKCQKVIAEKSEMLKALAVEIGNTDLIGTKTEDLQKCTMIAFKSMDKIKQKDDAFLSLRDLMIEEFELLVKLPLRVITRSWEDDYLPEVITQELPSQSRLMNLLQLQPKTVLVFALEKIAKLALVK